MQQDNPVPRHLEPEMSLVAAGPDFSGFVKDGRHARVRHVRLHRNVGARDGTPRRIHQPEVTATVTDPSGLGRNFMFNRDCAGRVCWSGAGGDERSCYAGAQ